MLSRKNAAHDDRLGRSLAEKSKPQIKWAELIGPEECPMMRRWVLVTPLGSVRLHHFLRPDHDRHPHDHPWWFVTLILKGGYLDRSILDGEPVIDRLTAGSIRFRPALHRHWVETHDSWSLVVTGRIRRQWGFWESGVFAPVADYFRRYGYAPCQD